MLPSSIRRLAAAVVAAAWLALTPRTTLAAEATLGAVAYVTLVDDLHMGPVVIASPTQEELDAVLSHPEVVERDLAGQVGFASAEAVPRERGDVCVLWMAYRELDWVTESAGTCPEVRDTALNARIAALHPDPQGAGLWEPAPPSPFPQTRSHMSPTARGYLGAAVGTGVAVATIPFALGDLEWLEFGPAAVSLSALVVLPSTGHFMMGKVGAGMLFIAARGASALVAFGSPELGIGLATVATIGQFVHIGVVGPQLGSRGRLHVIPGRRPQLAWTARF